MGKELYQFIFSISSDISANPASTSDRSHGKTAHGTFRSTGYDRIAQVLRLFGFQIWIPMVRIALLAGIMVISFSMRAQASEVTNDQNGDANEVTYRAPAPSPVTIVNNNHPPAAEAGNNISTNAGERVVLDGSGSSDLDGDRLSYAWVQKSGPAADLSSVNGAQCSFTAPAPIAESSAMIFELKVTDDKGESSEDTCIVLVHAIEQGLENEESIIYDDPSENKPPMQPAVTSIADGLSDVSLTPLLRASRFDDPDPDDYHTRTEWRIFLAGGVQQIILDRTCDRGCLSEFRVPHLVLEPSREYTAQVRFFDDRGLSSPWSERVAFATSADGKDLNRNGIPDIQEIAAGMDMNGDAVSDLEQELVVKSLTTYNQRHIIGISVEFNDPAVQIRAAAGIDPAALTSPEQTAFYTEDETPYGFLGYRIEVDQPGEIVTVKLNLSDPLDPHRTQWIRHDAVYGISDCDVSTDMDDSGLIVNRYLVDGGDEDADGVANGVIVDLIGPLEANAVDGADNSSLSIFGGGQAAQGGSSGGCFIRSLL